MWCEKKINRKKEIMVKKFFGKKYYIQTLIALICLSFTIFGFGAGEIFITNEAELWFRYFDILPSLVLWGVIFVVGLFLILVCIPEKIRLIVCVVLYYLNISFYIQGNFIPNDYGTLNGEAIDWSTYSLRGVIGTLIWLAVAGICVVGMLKKNTVFLNAMAFVSVLVLLTQAVSLLGIYFVYGDNEITNEGFFTKEGEFTVSSTDNVIVLLLDCFDSEVMVDLIDKYPEEINEVLEDFTFYRNTVGGATRTKYAIPFIFTGETNKKNISYLEYLKDSSKHSPLYKELNKGDYDSRVYGDPLYFDLSQYQALDNLNNGRVNVSSKAKLSRKYLQLVLYKYVPQCLKPFFWMYSGDFDIFKVSDGGKGVYEFDDVGFYDELCETGLSVSTNKTAFRFYHFVGDHAPYTMNENCERVKVGDSDEIGQALGSIRIAEVYIQHLKKLNLFDEATIIIMSDHGCGRGVEQNPLFIVKDSNIKKKFSISDARMSYSKLSVFLANRLKDSSIMISDYSVEGKRYFYTAYENKGDISIVEWSSMGDAWDHDSFLQTGTVYKGDFKHNNMSYKLGEQLYFTVKATADPYEVSGFSFNEGTHTWTEGNEAKLHFDIKEKIKSDLVLNIKCGILGSSQTCVVKVNDHVVGAFRATKDDVHHIVIPRELAIDGVIDLSLLLPDAASIETDPRLLALAMSEMSIDVLDDNKMVDNQDEKYYYELGNTIYFLDSDHNGNKYCNYGFSIPEQEGTWTDGSVAQLGFCITNYDKEDVTGVIDYSTYHNKQHVIVYANESIIAEYDTQGTESKTITIPSDCIGEDGNVFLRFVLPDASSPLENGESSDPRKLALKISRIMLKE